MRSVRGVRSVHGVRSIRVCVCGPLVFVVFVSGIRSIGGISQLTLFVGI